MKILTWNINGIRSLPTKLKDLLESLQADVLCLQETKITRDVLDSEIALIENYNAYFSFCRKRSGYSGVATYCKDSHPPIAAEEGLTSAYSNEAWKPTLIGCYSETANQYYSKDQLKSLDSEGRVIITKYSIKNILDDTKPLNLHIVNVYCPRIDPEKTERKLFKLDFYNLLKLRMDEILKSLESHVIIVGDLNCSHKRIDHCDPDEDPEFDQNESRLWLTKFLYDPVHNSDGKFVDVFRQLNPLEKNAFTCWCTTLSARETNYGTRIDYILMDVNFFKLNLVKSIRHCTDVYGSDHCPVVVELDVHILPNSKLPDLCSKFMPEFRGVQQKLTNFFVKRTANFDSVCETNGTVVDTARKKIKLEKKTTTLLHFWDNSKEKTESKNVSLSKTKCKDEKRIEGESSSNSSSQSSQSNEASKIQWKNIFAPATKRPVPNCNGHNEPCTLRTVKKQGPNVNRQFYCCARAQGTKDNKDARCNHFEWIS